VVHLSLLAGLPPRRWLDVYAARVSGWFRGFPKMVSSAGNMEARGSAGQTTRTGLIARCSAPKKPELTEAPLSEIRHMGPDAAVKIACLAPFVALR
jgi:hypothetical protein